jgi:hypothetical protein
MVVITIPSVALAQQTPTKPPAKLTLYKTADSAACSGDATVWVDPDAHVCYLKGDQYFGKTKHGGLQLSQADRCRRLPNVQGSLRTGRRERLRRPASASLGVSSNAWKGVDLCRRLT